MAYLYKLFTEDERIYNAIINNDFSEVVMMFLYLMEESKIILYQAPEKKSEVLSYSCRYEGNAAYKKSEYHEALVLYNNALLLAPKDSLASALAYNNRSALLLRARYYEACLTDIYRCMALNCSPRIVDKLIKREKEATANNQHIFIENYQELKFLYGIKLIDIKTPRNPDIPCASRAINVIVGAGIPKVITVKAVEIGTTLVLEQAYISFASDDYKFTSCYYCQKINLNMIPCDNCCTVLFCSDGCKERCIAEYHQVECKVLSLDNNYYARAAIKLRNSFDSWKEFNEASLLLGSDRIKISDASQIYNGENKFSVLNFSKDRHFTSGRIFNCGLNSAEIIMKFLQKGTFFPENHEDKMNAIRSFSRVLMYMGLNIGYIEGLSSVVTAHQTYQLQHTCSGIYPLIGKLPHSCDPNVLAVGLNNRIALVAVKPMKPGTELTISYAGHRLDHTFRNKQSVLLVNHGIICSCHICKGVPLTNKMKLNEAQMRAYNNLNSKVIDMDYETIEDFEPLYRICVNTLTVLSEVPFSEEYKFTYALFRKYLLIIQDCFSPNIQIQSHT